MIDLSEQTVIDQVAQRLTGLYPGLGPDKVAAVVQQNHALFSDSRIRDFVPLFVERRSRKALAEIST